MKKERNHAFDLLCGICILRMVTQHIVGFCGKSEEAWWVEVMAWTYFFMSFFFFKAGYFNKNVSGDTASYVMGKAKRLFVPYLTAGWIGLAIYFAFLPPLLDRFHAPVEHLEWQHIWMESGFYGNRPTWFLFSFFTAYIVVHFIEKVRYLHWGVLLFPCISYWLFLQHNPLWMSLNNVFMGVFFFYLGRMWHMAMDRFRGRMLPVSVLLVAGFVAGNFLWRGDYTMSSNTFTGSFPAVMLKTTMALCGISGILLCIGVPRIPWICHVGEHSMVYFVSHYPMIYIYKFTHLCFGRSIFGRWDELLILIPAVFCICSWLVPYVEAIPWLSGRWEEKK